MDSWSDSADLDGIIGPTCSGVCINVGLMAAAWNIPMVSQSCMSERLSDKNVYPTFSRVVEPLIKYSLALAATIDAFG